MLLELADELLAKIVSFLPISSVLQLSATSKTVHTLLTSTVFAEFHQRGLGQLLKVRMGCARLRVPKWFTAEAITDSQLLWLVDSRTRALHLGESPRITDAALVEVGRRCARLEEFRLNRGSNHCEGDWGPQLRSVTAVGIVALVQGCSQLRELTLCWCTSVDVRLLCAALAASAAVNTLEVLNIDGLGADEEDIANIAQCKVLHTLFMKDACALDVSPLAACPLRVLHLCRGRDISIESIRAVALGRAQPTLKHLCCMGNWHMTVADASAIIEACPELKTFECVRGTALGRLRDRGAGEELTPAALAIVHKRGICLDMPH